MSKITNTLLAASAAFATLAADVSLADTNQVRANSYITTADGVQLYYKDWGPKDGQVVTFSHGWPLNSDSWESQMMFLADKGYRVIAHDRGATAAPASRGKATTWTTTPMTWQR